MTISWSQYILPVLRSVDSLAQAMKADGQALHDRGVLKVHGLGSRLGNSGASALRKDLGWHDTLRVDGVDNELSLP